MSRTYRNAWGPELRLRESRTEHKNDWRKNIYEEMEEVPDIDKVYVIINEWESDSIGDATLQEISGVVAFTTENGAWDALNLIAESYGVILPDEETSFSLPDTYDIRNQSYFIQELNLKGDN